MIEPVDRMGMHVEKIPVRIGLEKAAYGVPEPRAVEFDQLAYGLRVDYAVQKGHQADIVGGNVP